MCQYAAGSLFLVQPQGSVESQVTGPKEAGKSLNNFPLRRAGSDFGSSQSTVMTEPNVCCRVVGMDGDWTMTIKTTIAAAAMLLSAMDISFAQSLPNYGPNAPPRGDSFGQPPSGTYPPGSGYRAYAYRVHHWHHWHHRYWRHPRPAE